MKSKILRICLAVLTLLLLTGMLTFALTGETIPRAVVSSGGGQLQGTGLVLQSTVGQPLSGIVSEGVSGLNLCSGFQCGGAIAFQPLALAIAVSGYDVLLSWPPQAGTYTSYEILHSLAPYFQPDDPGVVVVPTLHPDHWFHGGAAGSVANNHCYFVRGITPQGGAAPVSNKKCEFTFPLAAGTTGSYGSWNLSRTIAFNNPQAAHYNPLDGLIYVGRYDTATDGLYRIESDDSATLLAAGDRIAAVAVDPQTGHIFASEGNVGEIYRTDFGSTGRTTWVSGFHSGDDDPVGMAFAPALYNGTVIAPGDGLVVDRGVSGPDEVWRFSPSVAEGETAVHTDNGTLVDANDITIGINDVYLVDDKDDGDGVIYRVHADGALTAVSTNAPLPGPDGIATDPMTGDLIIVDIGDDKVYRVNPATGAVSDALPGFSFTFTPADQASYAGVDFAPDGQTMISTDKGVNAIYVFTRVSN